MRKILLTIAFLFLAVTNPVLAKPRNCTFASDCLVSGARCVRGVCFDSSGNKIQDCDNPEDADTALGCIPTTPRDLVQWVLKYAILMGGGIAFLLSVWGGATILLSAGNPEKINEGREIIVSAISGLLFIVFSVFLLRLIGVDILGIT